MNIIGKSLFKSNALQVAEVNKPFWYTSGTIGPFFINTHFLYNNEDDAKALLKFIDKNKSERNFPSMIMDKVVKMYDDSSFFKNVIDVFYASFKDDPDFINCDYVSGGERRDWFFSPIIAKLSGKKLLFIYKDLQIYEQHFSQTMPVTSLANKKIAHIADLINKGSSYTRSWLPAIKQLGGKLIFTASVVDRNQGGKEIINKKNIKVISPVIIDRDFFMQGLSQNVINKEQLKMIEDFLKDSIGYGKNFILNNPDFLLQSLTSEYSSKAKKCINENPYNFDKNFLEQFNK